MEEEDCASIIQNLIQHSSSVVAKELKEFTIINGELYFQSSNGVLAQVVSKAKAEEELNIAYELSC